MDERAIAEEDELSERGGTSSETLKTYVAESNFAELAPEEQECVRERFARFFISIFLHE